MPSPKGTDESDNGDDPKQLDSSEDDEDEEEKEEQDQFPYRDVLNEMLCTKAYNWIIFAVVLISAGMVVCDTFDYIDEYGPISASVNASLMGFFTAEFVILLVAMQVEYFKSAWNIVDFSVVIVGVVEDIILFVEHTQDKPVVNEGILRYMKALKSLRVLKLARFLPNSQNIISSLYQSAKAMGPMASLMVLVLLLFSIFFRETYGLMDPNRFGTLYRTVVTLFNLLTLDDWSMIYIDSRDKGQPEIIIFLIIYLLLQVFVLFSLVISLMVDKYQQSLYNKSETKLQQLQDAYEEEKRNIMAVRASLASQEAEIQEYMKTYKGLEPQDLSKREIELISRYRSIMPAIDELSQKCKAQSVLLEMLVDQFFEISDGDASM